MTPTEPADLFLALRQQYRTWAALAAELGITKSYLSKLVNGSKPLTPELRAKLTQLSHRGSYYYPSHTGNVPARLEVIA